MTEDPPVGEGGDPFATTTTTTTAAVTEEIPTEPSDANVVPAVLGGGGGSGGGGAEYAALFSSVNANTVLKEEVDAMASNLECSLCLGPPVVEPVVTPCCGVTYCRACLLTTVRDEIVTCPTCSKKFPFNTVKKNFALENFLSRENFTPTKVLGAFRNARKILHDYEDLQKRNTQLTEELNSSQRNCEMYKSRAEMLQGTVSTLEARIKKMESDCAQQISEQSRELQVASMEKADLGQKLETAQTLCAKLRGENVQLQKQLATVKQSSGTKDTSTARLGGTPSHPPSADSMESTWSVTHPGGAISGIMSWFVGSKTVKPGPMIIQINQFDLFEQLGEFEDSGYFRAVKKNSKKEKVMLQKLPLPAVSDALTLTKTFKQPMLLSKLAHLCIIPVTTIVQGPSTDNWFFLEHPYYKYDLDFILRSNRTYSLTLESICNTIFQLLHTLSYLHSHGVVHRYLRPSVILLREFSAITYANHIVLSGFSHATQVEPANITTSLPPLLFRAASNQAPGVPPIPPPHRYHAPEVINGTIQDWKAADVWSVGCILGEMLYGRPLFTMAALNHLAYRSTEPVPGHIKSSSPIMAQLGPQGFMFLEKLLPQAPGDAVSLLSSLLRSGCRDRPTAEAALEHAYFSPSSSSAPLVHSEPPQCVALADPGELADSEVHKFVEQYCVGMVHRDPPPVSKT
ncbi:extracellular response kinase [Pelomyxa schiedti]|nr:extracellular response kinase [Pelomyxa schiedti]